MRALRLSLTGTVIVALLGGLGGTVVAQDEPADPMAPVEVTGELIDLTCGGSAGNRTGLLVEDRETTCEIKMEWSDPRLDGTDTYSEISVEYTYGSGLSVGHYVHNIVTDDGAWRMRPQFRIGSMDGPENFTGTWVLDGEGAYEGLSVVLAKDELDSVPLTGYIISTDVVPPAPEGVSTE